ncbi:hypothetical protein BDA96_01G211700 [Sorghum bicolor]|uniref:Pectinesterase inhibitor domain-containing protein n=2 Tax=Sorghum bicolor TaxID=4558 RepID=A0A921RZY7_SORBI|nr:21 kDa protein [Sorghum bicolor]EER91394.1 hypothetical protein SORBI_3001G198800 [Sorghum bicolor]KAG0548945.1 hypothetical protein BDA96_01G211700 [Sorghum bicolor]|eukprot:XP_002464396.1 21 kDa protein [Sorghum bicolor]
MARSRALLLFLLALSCCWSWWCGAVVVTARPTPSTTTTAGGGGGGGFIASWCAGTDYPALCNATLAPYAAEVGASPARLSLAALTVTLGGARKATAAMKAMAAGASRSSPVAAEAAEDCVGMLEDAVGLLRQSVEAMERIGKEEEEPSGSSGQQGGSGSSRSVRFQVNSVQTWASAAMTNDDMCVEGGQAAVVREAVRGNVAGAMHLTANALAIVNAMAKQIS